MKKLVAERSTLVVVATAFLSGLAGADSLRLQPSNEVDLALGAAQADTAGETSAPAPMNATPAWGTKNSWTLNFTAGYADDFDNTGIVPVTFGFSWFPIDDFSIDVQAEAAWVSQPGDDAVGAGLAMLLRWHFLHFGEKGGLQGTLYADVGIGFLVFNDPVPANASDFVFTPRAGVGASWVITDQTRLLTGVRWFHISNAQTAQENPGLNALQLYAGLSFSF